MIQLKLNAASIDKASSLVAYHLIGKLLLLINKSKNKLEFYYDKVRILIYG